MAVITGEEDPKFTPPATGCFTMPCDPPTLVLLVKARALSGCTNEDGSDTLTTLADGSETGRRLCCNWVGREPGALLTFATSADFDEDDAKELVFCFLPSLMGFESGFWSDSD
jgi:hypothetical protein